MLDNSETVIFEDWVEILPEKSLLCDNNENQDERQKLRQLGENELMTWPPPFWLASPERCIWILFFFTPKKTPIC